MAQDLDNLPLRLFPAVPEVRDTGHHLMSCDRLHVLALGDKNIHGNPPVVRDHKAKGFIFLVKAHHLPVGVLQNPQDGPLGPSLGAGLPLNKDLHLIAVKGSTGFLLGDKHILLLALHSHKAKAPGISRKYSREGEGLRPSVFSSLGNAYLSLCRQGGENLLKLPSLGFGDT